LSIAALALGGLADALYFTLAYYGRIRQTRWVPEILCPREGSSCLTVVRTPYARVFGLPNSLLGMFYYLALLVWVLLAPCHPSSPDNIYRAFEMAGVLLLGASLFTVVFGFYLVHALRRVLHTDCPLCYAAHAVNIMLLVLLPFVT
jgi:uncharacterized membrane protein